MSGQGWARGAGRSAWISGSAVAVLSLVLLTDGFVEKGRAAVEKQAVEALELRVLTEAAAAEELAALTETHTLRSVARQRRNTRLGWGLLVATVLFVGSVKIHQRSTSGRQPALVTLGPPAVDGRGRSRQLPAVAPPAFEPVDGVDLSFVDGVVETEGRSRESAIPILQALQNHYRYLPEAALRRVCDRTQIEPAQITGVASFYSQFRRDPVGRYLVRVCHGTACHVAGIGPIMDEMRRRLGIEPDADTDPARRFTLESVNCLGCCSLAPVMMVEDHVAGRLTPNSAWEELEVMEGEA